MFPFLLRWYILVFLPDHLSSFIRQCIQRFWDVTYDGRKLRRIGDRPMILK
jgi:hypothetical protein